ncbi:hypothetical protein F4808DRAFT_471458 [Astrocystis sublimbata]|nr:hypothetical protein F4808DRAFT_471458 [Astrocystis sublimbata]
MVSLEAIRESNARLAGSLPDELNLVKRSQRPRIYFLGRREAEGQRVQADLETLNPRNSGIPTPSDFNDHIGTRDSRQTGARRFFHPRLPKLREDGPLARTNRHRPCHYEDRIRAPHVSSAGEVLIDETGERQTFFATSARFPPGGERRDADGVALAGGLDVAVGANGKMGGGVYSIDWEAEGTSPRVQTLISDFKEDETAEKLWKHTEDEYMQSTGSLSM